MSSGVPKVVIDNREPAPGGAMLEATSCSPISAASQHLPKASARRVVDLLNDYFSYMADVIGAKAASSTSISAMPSWCCSAFRDLSATTPIVPWLRHDACIAH